MDNSQQSDTEPQMETVSPADENSVKPVPAAAQPTEPTASPGVQNNLTSPPIGSPANSLPPPLAASGPVKSHNSTPILKILIILMVVAGVGIGGYLLGNQKSAAKTVAPAQSTKATTEQELIVPHGATVIAQCAKGRGTQYALPKDIPLGPVYNVYQGKIIGIEFMVGKDDLLVAAKSFLNLPLYSTKYEHVNIGLLSQGHAGFPSPHYHVDIMAVPTSETDKITCT